MVTAAVIMTVVLININLEGKLRNKDEQRKY